MRSIPNQRTLTHVRIEVMLFLHLYYDIYVNLVLEISATRWVQFSNNLCTKGWIESSCNPCLIQKHNGKSSEQRRYLHGQKLEIHRKIRHGAWYSLPKLSWQISLDRDWYICWLDMMTPSNGNISALLAICAVNSTVTGKFPAQRPVTRNFVFFDQCLNRRLSKQWWGWWFETP